MSRDAAFWDRLRQARTKLADQMLPHPAVSLVDIGLRAPHADSAPVLQVHLRRPQPPDLVIPDMVDGFDVQIVAGDYLLQKSSA